MSNEVDTLGQHSVSKALNVFLERVNALKDDKSLERYREHLDKLRAIGDYIWGRLRSADPLLLAEDQLSAIEGQIREASAQLAKIGTEMGVARLVGPSQHIKDALTYASQALGQSSNVPAQFPVDAQQFREILVSVRQSAGHHQRALEQEAAALGNALQTAKAEAAKVVADINSQKGRLDKAIADFQAQFSKAEDGRRDNFGEDLRRWTHDFNSELDRAKEALSQTEKDLLAKVGEIESDARGEVLSHLKDLRKYKADAQKLVGVIGNTGTVIGFQEAASSAARSARLWEQIAFGSLAALVIFGIVIFVMTTKEGFDWHLLAARALLVIPLGVLAGYAAHKAEQQRIVERTSRRMALELASISPYLATMPDDDQHEVKRLLAEKFFAQPQHLSTVSDKPAATGTPTDLLRSALDSLKAALEVISKK